MPPQSTTLLLVIGLYLAACLVLGFLAWRRTVSLADFILGGRSLGSWVTAFSAQASDMSGWLLMGLPGLAYAAGLDAVWLATGLAIGTWLNWRYIAAPLRSRTEALSNSLTLPDYFERRFEDGSRLLRSIAALFILVFFIFYTSSGFVAAGRLFQSLFDMSYPWAIFWGSVVMLAYTFFGGFLAVSWSDVLQGTLMFFALIVVAALGVMLAGGPLPVIARLQMQDEVGQSLGVLGIVSLLAWGLGYPGQPHILARFMAIQSIDDLATSRRVAMTWVIAVLAAAIVVGITGLLVLPQPLAGAETERVFILMSTQYLPPVLAGLCLAGILAAVMSTAAAQLLVASSAFTQDFYRSFFRPGASTAELLWVGRAAVFAVAVLAFVIGLDPDSKVLDLVAWAWAGFGAAFGPAIVLSLYWPRMTRNAALAGMIAGGVTVIAWKQCSGPLFEVYELLPGFVLSLAAIWVMTVCESSSRGHSR